MGDEAGSCVSLTFGTPADRVHIGASVSLSGKSCFQQGGSIVAVLSRSTACCY